ncbi:hypothetical protein ACFOG5_06060 [Pedobacter fastidiosus]
MLGTLSNIEIAKEFFHEAFHANIMQQARALFGSPAVGLWTKGPEDMSLIEVVEKMDAEVLGKPDLEALHHQYMAMNVENIFTGLKTFAQTNSTNYNSFNDGHFKGLAYEGLHTTPYYLNYVVKDGSGNDRTTTYFGQTYTLADYYITVATILKDTNVSPCTN